MGSLVREGNASRKTDIGEAQRGIVTGMKRVADKYGPESVGVFVSPDLTNEELHLAARIAREGFGTNNIASLSILGTGREAGVLDDSFGFTASTVDRSCIAEADLIICNNTSMESDHLVLAVEVIEAVRKGAKLIVSNSTLDTTDQHLSTLAMDPMRGRASILWNGVLQVLLDDEFFKTADVKKIEGSKEFLSKRDFAVEDVSKLSGIDPENIRKAAGIIREAKRIVFIHSPDRTQDQAPGDMETLANLAVLLRSSGARVDLLLPRNLSNSAALEIVGADPAFAPGRTAPPADMQGARTHAAMRELLDNGEIRAAFIIGEDPLAWRQTGSWFRNIEFLAAMDWTETETTQFADVVLPGSTYLETAGTRCNFEGKLVEFTGAVDPPAGMPGDEVLQGLCSELGLDTEGGSKIDGIVKKGLGDLAAYYWNKGEERSAGGVMRLVPVEPDVRTGAIPPPLTHGERYKREIREVGTERFRVRY